MIRLKRLAQGLMRMLDPQVPPAPPPPDPVEIPRFVPFAVHYNAAGGPTNNIHPLTLGICVGLMQR